jgi:phosphoglycerate kinase
VHATLNNARKNNKHIILPLDYVVSKSGWQGPYTTVAAGELKPEHMSITIGPQTQRLIQQHIARANTIVFNGPSGDLIYPKTCLAIQELFKTFCQSNAYKLVAGADSIAVLEYFKLRNCVTYCSSGGGASIAYLSGQELAGLKPFCT